MEIPSKSGVMAPSDEQPEVQKINAKLQELLGDNFTYLKHIGAGVGGDVYLCKYTGSEKNIIDLCDNNNRISIKILINEHETQHEAKIAEELFHKLSKNNRFNVGTPIIKDNKIVALVMQYIAYDDSPDIPLEDSLKSFLRKFYQSVVVGSAKDKMPRNTFHRALYADYGIICAQLINEMYEIISEFHKLGYLHLDIASRNFILNKPVFDSEGNIIKFTLTLCDYGHSDKMDENNSVNTYQRRNRKPITARNHQDITNCHATVSTDIFAFKCAIIGMISMTVADLMHDYSVLDIGQQSLKEFKEMRTKNDTYRNDNKVLEAYLKKLSEFVNFCPDSHIKHQAKEIISHYSEYIHAMPTNNQGLINVHNFDRKALLTANAKFFESMLQKKVNNIENVDDRDSLYEFLLSIKRLIALPLTDDFKKSKRYQDVKVIDDIDKVKKYILLLHKMNIENSKPQKENIAPSISGNSEQLKWVDDLNHAIIQWKKDHSAIEIKWFGVSFENKVNGIINNIMQHKINSFAEANSLLNTVVKEFSQQIEQKNYSPLLNSTVKTSHKMYHLKLF